MKILSFFRKDRYIFKPPRPAKQGSAAICNKWKCFGCCHVRTATVIIGLWHLAVHIMGIFLYIVAHYIVPNYYCDFPTLPKVPSKEATAAELTVRKIDISNTETFLPSELKLFTNEHGIKLWLFLTLFSFVTNIFLIIGAVKKNPALILPFFFLQIFDLLFDTTIITVYVLMSSNMTEFFNQLYNPPVLQFLLHFGYYQKMIFTVAYVFVAFFTKVYLMHVVWLCYKFANETLEHRKEGARWIVARRSSK